jgi:hypothetical protein
LRQRKRAQHPVKNFRHVSFPQIGARHYPRENTSEIVESYL